MSADRAAWFHALPPATRAALRELCRVRRCRNLIACVFLSLWIGPGVLVLGAPPWPARLAAYVVMGAALHACGILMHEAVHGNFFRHPALDRWSAFLLGAPVCVSGSAYRVTHLLHHRHTRGAEDPDEFTNYVQGRRGLSVLFYAWGVVGLLIFLAHVPATALRRGTRADRVAVLTEYALLVALYGVVALIAARRGATEVLVRAWLIPMAVAAAIVNVRGWAEHMLTQPGHPLTQTRTVTSNAVVRFLMCNLNYHLEHHLFPGMPWYHLPKAHALLAEDYRRAGAFVYGSYLAFLWDAVRAGVHGLAPKRAPAGAAR